MFLLDGPGPGSAPIIDAPIDPNAEVDWGDGEENAASTPPAPGPDATAPATPAAQPTPPAPAQPAIPSTPTPPSTPPAASAASPVAPPPSAAPAAPAAPEPWTFKADGGDVFIEGSAVNPDGSITIPQSSLENLSTILAEGVAHRGSFRQEIESRDSRIAQLEQQVGAVDQSPEILRARAYNQQLLAIMAKGPEAVAQWLDDYEKNFPVFQAKAELAIAQAESARYQAQVATHQEQASYTEIAPKIEATLSQALGDGKAKYPTVDAEKLYSRIVARHWDQVVYEAAAADRARGLQQGEQLIGKGPKGQLYIVNTGLILDEFEYQASLMQGSAAAATAAVAHNRAMATPAAAPPAVTAAAAALGGAGDVTGDENLPKTKQELEDWIGSGAWRKHVFKSAQQ